MNRGARPRSPFIEVVTLHVGSDLDMGALRRSIERTFRLPTRVSRLPIDPAFAFDSGRQQYRSTAILTRLVEERSVDAVKILGVTDVDLFIPILTFVFGEALLDGPAAVLSACRLRPAFFGLPDDGPLLADRLAKEAIHELAHTFGLIHCPDTFCVLNSSASADHIDIKGQHFCIRCQQKLNRRLEELTKISP